MSVENTPRLRTPKVCEGSTTGKKQVLGRGRRGQHAARTSSASSRTFPLDLALVLDAAELQR